MPTSLYSKDEKVLCFHQELLYDAKILDVRHKDPNDKKSEFEYLVHYKGWKNTWDDWVTEERLRKLTEENRELAAHLKRNLEASLRLKQTKSSSKKRATSDRSSVRDSEDPSSAMAPFQRGNKRARGDQHLQSEDEYYAVPSIHFLVDDNLKSLLVDDWERITKHFNCVKLPHTKPIRLILQDWYDHDSPRLETRMDRDVLGIIKDGLCVLFDKYLDLKLLYNFERPQLRYLHDTYGSTDKKPCDIYGAEHLIRLLTTIGDLMVEGDFTPGQVRCWQEELTRLANWLSRNSHHYFLNEYVSYEDSFNRDKRYTQAR